jgi:RHS repeat-associated protein
VQQSFDTIGRLCAVGTSGSTCSSGTTYATGFAYNAAFQVTGFNYGNGVAAAFGYTPDRLLLQSLAYTKGSSTLFSTNYWYKTDSTNCPNGASGNNGQIQCITDNVDSGRTISYAFDALYRLTSATTNGSANYAKWGLSMSYDRYGNRTAQSVSSGCVSPMVCPTSSVTVSATTNQITGSPYSYDANGNMTNDGNNTLVYDAENHVLSATNGGASGTYTYDGNSLRVKKASGSTTTVYIFAGSKVIAEYDNGAAVGSPSREYIYSGSSLLAKIDSSSTKYYHQDQLSNRVVTDSSGNTLEQLGHYPFGESWYNATNDKLLFTTYERDAESGNDYAMMRSYVNRLARFSSPDPLSGSTGSPQTLNRYAYTAGDPVDFTDPTGMILCGNCPPPPPEPEPEPGDNDLFGGPLGLDPPPNLLFAGPKGGGGGNRSLRVKFDVLEECTKKWFGVTANVFAAAIQGQNGASGLNGTFSGTLNDPSGLTFSFSVLTDVNSYSADDAYAQRTEVVPGVVNVALGYTPEDHPFVNFAQSGLSAGDTLQTQLTELGNSLYLISRRMTPAQMHARDNSPKTSGFGTNDAPGGDLLDCVKKGNGLVAK